MYKSTHHFMQGKANGLNPFEFANGDEVMTEGQKRDVLKTRIATIDKRLTELPANHAARKDLGRERHVVQAQLSDLKSLNDKNGVERFFVQAAKEMLSAGQFNVVMQEAIKMLKRYKESEAGAGPKKYVELPKPVKRDLEQAVKEFVAKGGSITKAAPGGKFQGMAHPRVAALTSDQHRVYKKLRACGICKEDALREAAKPQARKETARAEEASGRRHDSTTNQGRNQEMQTRHRWKQTEQATFRAAERDDKPRVDGFEFHPCPLDPAKIRAEELRTVEECAFLMAELDKMRVELSSDLRRAATKAKLHRQYAPRDWFDRTDLLPVGWSIWYESHSRP